MRRAGRREKLKQIPLTLEDVLHPQEGDHIPQNPVHQADIRYLSCVCAEREPRLDNGLVLTDCIVDWGIPGLGNHCPDISVFEKLKERPAQSLGIFRVRAFGRTLPARRGNRLAGHAQNDVEHKLVEYHQAKVALYVIVDQKKAGGPRELLAFGRKSTGYVKKKLDRRGRILVKQLGIRIGLQNNRVVCFDAETDHELGDYVQIVQALQAAEQARQNAEQARQNAEQARQNAEERASEEAQARRAAELARQNAEEAFRASESRVQELEAELRRSRGRAN